MKIRVTIEQTGGDLTTTIELPDGLSEDEVEKEAKEPMLDMIDWHYEIIDS